MRGVLLWPTTRTAVVDYAGVPDTPAYLSPLLQAGTSLVNLNVVSGLQDSVADGEWSLSFNPASINLVGATVVSAEYLNAQWNTLLGHGQLFLSQGATPGALIVTSTPGSFSGYVVFVGSGTNGELHRYNGGVDSGALGTFPYVNYAGADIALQATVNAGDVTLRGFRNGVQVGSDIVDSSGSRITSFATVGYSLREAFGSGVQLQGFRFVAN